MISRSQTNDSPTGEVDHGGDVGKAFPGTHVADIATPGGIDLMRLGGEVTLQQVGRLNCRRVSDRRPLTPPLSAADKATRGHQAGFTQ